MQIELYYDGKIYMGYKKVANPDEVRKEAEGLRSFFEKAGENPKPYVMPLEDGSILLVGTEAVRRATARIIP